MVIYRCDKCKAEEEVRVSRLPPGWGLAWGIKEERMLHWCPRCKQGRDT